jgi:hypothetical protein
MRGFDLRCFIQGRPIAAAEEVREFETRRGHKINLKPGSINELEYGLRTSTMGR